MSLLPISTYPQNPIHKNKTNINLQIPKPSSNNHNAIKIHAQKPNSNPQPHKEIDSKDVLIPKKTKRGSKDFVRNSLGNTFTSIKEQNPDVFSCKDPILKGKKSTHFDGDKKSTHFDDRGRKSEEMKVEDFVRNSLGNTISSIKEQNPDVISSKDQILKGKKSTHFDGGKKSTHFDVRGEKSETRKVEDFVRNSLGKTFTSIKEQNPDVISSKDQILKDKKSTHFDGRKTKRGRKNSLGNTFTSIKEQNPDVFSNKDPILKEKKSTHFDFIDEDGDNDDMVVDEEDIDWPIDGEVGWGTSASKYFEEYPIRNLVGEDGVEIDWEGEIEDSWIQEINCLEWEAFAFHPSPLIVLVFERYHRASDNWKLLKEIEKALQVYWNAKDRLPPRAVKLDINIERDLAYALKVRECPQLLFLRGQKILYREKEFRSADELVQMIAYFYYKAKKPTWIDEAILRL